MSETIKEKLEQKDKIKEREIELKKKLKQANEEREDGFDISKMVVNVNGVETIGFIYCYSLVDKEMGYRKNDILNAFFESGLDEKFAPQVTTPYNAFQRATSQLESIEYDCTNESFDKAKYIVRKRIISKSTNVNLDEKKWYRTVSLRKDYDSKAINESVDFENVIAVFELDGEEEEIRTVVQSQYKNNPQIVSAMEQTVELYNSFLDHFSSAKLRGLVKRVLDYVHPIPIKSGGVYFVTNDKREVIDQLNKFLELLGGEGIVINVANIKDQRSLVQRKVSGYVNELMDKLKDPKFKFAEKREKEALLEEINAINSDFKLYQHLAEQDSMEMTFNETLLETASSEIVNQLIEDEKRKKENISKGREKIKQSKAEKLAMINAVQTAIDNEK